MRFIFHPRIRRDLRAALAYYEEESRSGLADRFFCEAEAVVEALKRNLQAFHYVAEGLRRAPFRSFPYHFVYEEDAVRVRVLVLRHDRRHPDYGCAGARMPFAFCLP